MMDWDKLRIFHAVAEAGSFTRAGDSLGLSQSAVSRQIGALEEDLGVSLFHRHARGLLLTEQGELLSLTVRKILADLSRVEGQLLDARELAEGPLRVTTAEFIGSTWLAPRLTALQERCPGLELTLILDERIFNLGMREADAAVRLYPPDQAGLIHETLGVVPFCLCASPAYLERAGGPPERLSGLSEHVLIGYPQDVIAPFANPNWLFQVAGVGVQDSRVRKILINSVSGMLKVAESGGGIAALPEYLVRESPSLHIIMPEVVRTDVVACFVYPEEREYSRRIKEFGDFLRESAKGGGIFC